MSNLSYQYIPHSKPLITDSDKDSVFKVLTSGMVAEGQKVGEFEELVSEYLNLAGGVATGSGAAAIFLALKALEIGQNDEVIIPTYVCQNVLDAVLWSGATPVLCDISDDWCVGAESVKPHINHRTKAIIVVHTFGIAADIKPIIELGIPIIEDCAQAFGCDLDGIKLGNYGAFCVCSFNATKLLCTGEGGMVLSKDRGFVNKLKYIKCGNSSNNSLRYNFKLSDLQAAMGVCQLRQYADFLKRRRLIAETYFNRLSKLESDLPTSIKGRSVFFRFPIRVKTDFDLLRSEFNVYGVKVRRGVDALLHRVMGLRSENYPNAELLYSQTLSLPIYPALDDAQIEHVINVCLKVLG